MLRPLDIQNKEFTKKLKGYDCDEVDTFLDEVIKDYEQLCKDNQALRDKLGLMTKSLESYRLIEESLKKSLEVADRTADDIKKNAKAEAQTIISKAKLDAGRLSKQIDDEHMRTHQNMMKMKSETAAYKARIKNACEGLIQMLDDIDAQ